MDKTGKLIVISGPSGVGKSTVVKEVLARTGAEFSVSATTRQPRAGEADGRDYRFVDRGRFEKMIADGDLLEWAEVFGNFYGTPAKPVLDAVAAGKKIILDIDVQGGLQVAAKMPDATFVLLLPPSDEELASRLAGRKSEDAASLRRRLAKAKEEISAARQSGVYNHYVVNDDLPAAVGKVVDIVNQERSKR
ncbi:MAG: guanylate kinase [Planctomycetaceae bacterium]|nr:MAG: guanylate kinase [Planctomycetaceae bacterium]